MRMSRSFLMLGALLVAPGLVQAQSVSKDFVNAEPCGGALGNRNVPGPEGAAAGNMNMKIVFGLFGGGGGNRSIRTADIAMTGCDTGATVARKLATGICDECVLQFGAAALEGNDGNGFCGGVLSPCSCADTALNTAAVNLDCKASIAGGTSGFNFSKPSSTLTGSVFINQLAPSGVTPLLVAVNHNTNSGNRVGTDLLPRAVIQVVPDTANGVVQFRYNDSTSGQPAFTVNTTGLTSKQIHDAIAAELVADGFAGSPPAEGYVSVESSARTYSFSPERFTGEYFVWLRDVTQGGLIQRLDVDGVGGVKVEVENAIPPESIPALNAWGFGALVSLLLIATMILLRARA